MIKKDILLLFLFALTFFVGDWLHIWKKGEVKAQQKSLQLREFQPPLPAEISTVYDTLIKECKPAIYLYPEAKTNVHVVVEPKGHLTLTIPEYPAGGWNVDAYPDGSIVSGDNIFPYLYYESALKRAEVKAPEKGLVIKYEELEEYFTGILPRLGLNENEQKDFIDYWVNSLPKSPFYFVGIMERSEIDRLEVLTIDPKPDSILRVRFYFKPLEESVATPQVEWLDPEVVGFVRNGFSVVEWGGIVDLGEKEFICSQ